MTIVDRSRMAKIFWRFAHLHAVLALAFTAMFFNDDRQILGINGWIKPIKFALTGFVYLGTLALFARLIPDSLSPEKGNRHAWIISIMIFGETFFVAMQSARGVPSHFNQTTPFNGVIYSVMGVMIIVNTISFVIIMRHFFKRDQIISGPLLTGIRWGVVLFLFGSIVGGVMSALNRHTIGMNDSGPWLPFINFSTTAGDLRVLHFLGLHALQILPFIGWLMTRPAPASAMIDAP